MINLKDIEYIQSATTPCIVIKLKSLKEVREDTLDEIISCYKLRNVADNLPNIWAVVCYLERELRLEDKPDKIKRFAKLVTEQARNILLDNEKKQSLKRPLDRLGEESEGKETEPEEEVQVVQKGRKRKAKNLNKMAKMKDNEINEEQHGDSEGGGDEEQELSEMEEDEMEGVQVVQKRRNEKEKPEKAKPKKLRNYQIKLAKPVISGQNTIIISHRIWKNSGSCPFCERTLQRTRSKVEC
ncbi:uncharacterized protein [Antedon mediterranea]|uniref:uncharacterized protein n=1 Tax=Antedon mediterranea TaxID=105859 RepID=UPI003AF6B372